ncbi:hypothetical protein MSAN_00968200 [Mycena sanguinolenta]|uniref:Uncharacterized protein n=1 Tax=Mycena sanguinolenta TaxID=230812 RepID=A0A8H6YY42_9AGAR|nr:hypothetical protein MSAN_00968200 [Mycena sanguinolenta]
MSGDLRNTNDANIVQWEDVDLLHIEPRTCIARYDSPSHFALESSQDSSCGSIHRYTLSRTYLLPTRLRAVLTPSWILLFVLLSISASSSTRLAPIYATLPWHFFEDGALCSSRKRRRYRLEYMRPYLLLVSLGLGLDVDIDVGTETWSPMSGGICIFLSRYGTRTSPKLWRRRRCLAGGRGCSWRKLPGGRARLGPDVDAGMWGTNSPLDLVSLSLVSATAMSMR